MLFGLDMFYKDVNNKTKPFSKMSDKKYTMSALTYILMNYYKPSVGII